MFGHLPLEVIELILLFLTSTDIHSVFLAYNVQYSVLSDYFWKTVCHKEDLKQGSPDQKWHQCFRSGINKRLGHFVQLRIIPQGTLSHVYLHTLITCKIKATNYKKYCIYFLDDKNIFSLIQVIKCKSIKFKDKFLIVEDEENFLSLYIYSHNSNRYQYCKSLPEQFRMYSIFGISEKYCASLNLQEKHLSLYHNDKDLTELIILPENVIFVIDKILHEDTVVFSTFGFAEGYKIKVYDIISQHFILDLACLVSAGITNAPNVWVGSNFIGCCDVSYCTQGIYFWPVKVWNKHGDFILRTEIEPSTKHYLRCFFKDQYVILTMSDTQINVFNNFGEKVSSFYTSNRFTDVNLSDGHLLFILLEDGEVEVYDWKLSTRLYNIKLDGEVEVYDWKLSTRLYNIKLMSVFKKSQSLCGDWLYCLTNPAYNDYQVVKYF